MKITKMIFIAALFSSSSYAQTYYCPINIALTNQTDHNLTQVKIKNYIDKSSSTASANTVMPNSNLNLDFQSTSMANGKFTLTINGQTLCDGTYSMEFIPDIKNPCKLNMNYASYSIVNNPQQTAKLGIKCKKTGILNSLTQTSLTVGIVTSGI